MFFCENHARNYCAARVDAIHLRMTTYPRSCKELTRGMMYFPRMLDKIRLHSRGELHEDCTRIIRKISERRRRPTVRVAIFYGCIIATSSKELNRAARMRKFWNGATKKGVGLIKATCLFGMGLFRSSAGAIRSPRDWNNESANSESPIALTFSQSLT